MVLTEKEMREIMREDLRRRHDYFREYDPVLGDPKSEVLKRVPLVIDGVKYYVPTDMVRDPFVRAYRKSGDNPAALLRSTGQTVSPEHEQQIINHLFELRLKYDFEFYAATCVRIQDKQSKEMIPFILNKGQRILLKRFEGSRIARKPCRVHLTKARQWGGSTLTAQYFLWLQQMWYKNWHSCIVALDQTQATNIRTMMKNTIRFYPPFFQQTTFKRFEGTELIRYIPERGCRIQIGSSTKPDSLRSFDFSMIHLSEVGLWKDTATVTGSDLAQSMYATVPNVPGTVIVMESTAKGVGTFFHEQYLAAKENEESGNDGLLPVFVSWFTDFRNYLEPANVRTFLKQMTEYNWWQWRQGATLGGIRWYNNYKLSNHYNDFQMKSEYPTTAEEAFQSSQGKYFTEDALESLRSMVKKPQFMGDIRGDSLNTVDAMNNIKLYENDSIPNMLKIWIMPNDGVPDGKVVKNRFVVTVDVGGKSAKADWSVISVFDRLSLADEFGAVERAALWRGHTDPDLLAYKALTIATFYNNALLVIESNTYETKHRKEAATVYEGEHFYTVLDVIGDQYENMYRRRTSPDSTTDKPMKRVGWHMNKESKIRVYDFYTKFIRGGDYVEYSQDAADEAGWLLLTADGKIEAAKGTHDDIQDTTAVGAYIAHESMDRVRILDDDAQTKKPHIVSAGGGEATF